MNLSVLAQAATPQPTGAYGWSTIIMMVVLLLAFYFILIRPQRKKEKKDAEMRKNLQIGDEIVTVGGIVGIVCKIEEETLVIETGGDRSRLRIKKWAVSQNLDAEKEAAAVTAAAKAEKMGKKVPEEKGIEKKD